MYVDLVHETLNHKLWINPTLWLPVPPFISLASCIISARSIVCSTSPDPWHAFLHIYLCMYILVPVLQHIGRHPLGQIARKFSLQSSMEMVQICLNVFQSSFFTTKHPSDWCQLLWSCSVLHTTLRCFQKRCVNIGQFCKFCKEFRLVWVMLLL